MTKRTLHDFDGSALKTLTVDSPTARSAAAILSIVKGCTLAQAAKLIASLPSDPYPWDCEKLLIEQGLQFSCIFPMDHAAFAQADNAYEFVRNYYQSLGLWGSNWEAYWKSHANTSKNHAAEITSLARQRRRFNVTVREPTINDVTQAINGHQVVLTMTRAPRAKRNTLALSPTILHSWDPTLQQFHAIDYGDTEFIMALKEFHQCWQIEEGIRIISA